MTVLCGALLKKCMELMEKGIHPTAISDAFYKASQRAEEILLDMSNPVDLTDRDSFLKSASTSLNSKVIAHFDQVCACVTRPCSVVGAGPMVTSLGRKFLCRGHRACAPGWGTEQTGNDMYKTRGLYA